MSKAKYYVLVFATRQERTAGEFEHSFDCSTLDGAYSDADEAIERGSYAASIYERSGTTAPSMRVATLIQPLAAA